MNIEKVKLVADFHKRVLARLRDELGARFIAPQTMEDICKDPDKAIDFIVKAYSLPCGNFNANQYTWVMAFPYSDTDNFGRVMDDDVYVAGSTFGLGLDAANLPCARKILEEEKAKHPGWFIPDGVISVCDRQFENQPNCPRGSELNGSLVYDVDYGYTSYVDKRNEYDTAT